MFDLKKLREEFATLHTEAKTLLDTASGANRDLTAEETTANADRFAKMEAIKVKIDAQTKFATLTLDADKNAPAGGSVQLPRQPEGKEEHDKGRGIEVMFSSKDKLDHDREEFARAVRHWSATGEMDKRFATITTATQSSILLPKQVMTPQVTGAPNTLREMYAAWGLEPMQTPGNNATFNLPVMDPTAGGQVAENASSETENAPGLAGSIVSTMKTYQAGSVYFSNLQLGMNGIDLLTATVPHLRGNKELALESVIIAAMIADAGITQSVATATITGFTYANSVTLANKLAKRYQYTKVRLLSATAYAAAEGLVDDNNRPVMVNDPQNQTLKKMHGIPTFRCDYLEAFGANKVVGLELSLAGFHLRDGSDSIARYTQVPAKPDQTGINLFAYHAYGYSVSAVTKFTCPAS